ncbi:MAG: hypothetical protein NTV51_11190 [Verrucomicrobia bacterium]|nr:hypothetical protein [Verrucomicrobiota bacterium]
MTELPPLLQTQKKKRSVWPIAGIVVGVVVMLGLGAFFAIRTIVASGITKGPDAMFGDQHLKTAVALIELHKVRTGRYPEDLRKLQFTGQWDMIAVQSVRYVAAADGSSYYVEVQRGWIGKPELSMPAEFWRGTGYNAKLAGSP